MSIKIQVSKPSPCCGSWYRTQNDAGVQRCNLCGEICEKIIEEPDEKYTPHKTGKTWSKKKHRYFKKGETE